MSIYSFSGVLLIRFVVVMLCFFRNERGVGQIKGRQWKWKLKVYRWIGKNPFSAFGVLVKLKEFSSGLR